MMVILVIPAQAGIHFAFALDAIGTHEVNLDPGFRRDDDVWIGCGA